MKSKIIITLVFVFAAILVAVSINSYMKPPPEPLYTVVRICDAPMFRRSNDAIVKHRETGILYYRGPYGLIPVEPGTDLREICKRR